MNKKYLIPGVISGITFLLTYILFIYTDLTTLTVWTVNVWDNLSATHNFRNFYQYSAMNLYGLDHAMVGNDFLIYIPWAIWNLPIWVVQRVFDYPVAYRVLPQLWSKLFLVVMGVLCIIPVKRICNGLKSDSAKGDKAFCRMVFLSCTSFFTITSLAYTGQNDIMVIFTFLMALAGLIEGDKKGFYLWAALSIAFKPFFIFSYVAIILIQEKNLLRILGKTAFGFVFALLQKVPFLGAEMYQESLQYGPTSDGIRLLMNSVLDIPPAGASIFFLALGAFYLAVYFVDFDLGDKESYHYIYCATAPVVLLFMFTRYEPYRPFYLVPLLFVLMMFKPEYSRINLLLEYVATGCLMAFYLLDERMFYNPNYILAKSGEVKCPSISEFLTSKLPGLGYTFFTAVFVLCMTLILVINHPKFESKNKVLRLEEEPWLLTVRSLTYAIPLIISLIIKAIA